MAAEVALVLDTPVEPAQAEWDAPAYLSWDNGEISGPYGNWQRVRMTVRHVADLVRKMSPVQRVALLKEMDPDGQGLNWKRLQTDLENSMVGSLRDSLKTTRESSVKAKLRELFEPIIRWRIQNSGPKYGTHQIQYDLTVGDLLTYPEEYRHGIELFRSLVATEQAAWIDSLAKEIDGPA